MVLQLPKRCNKDNFWHAFRKGCASDEMYFATMLCCCGLIPDRKETRLASAAAPTADASAAAEAKDGKNGAKKAAADGASDNSPQVAGRRLTYVLWNYADLDNYVDKNALSDRPQTFPTITEALVRAARKEGCLFIRKVGSISTDAWAALVL